MVVCVLWAEEPACTLSSAFLEMPGHEPYRHQLIARSMKNNCVPSGSDLCLGTEAGHPLGTQEHFPECLSVVLRESMSRSSNLHTCCLSQNWPACEHPCSQPPILNRPPAHWESCASPPPHSYGEARPRVTLKVQGRTIRLAWLLGTSRGQSSAS